MMRLTSTQAAITAPLVTSGTHFPGIPIGRSLLDDRLFRLSPVRADPTVLPSTNSLALGGLGSGKSTTAKVRARREILDHGHQYVVIDSFGEENAGEWTRVTRSLAGRVVEAGEFKLNPVSDLFSPAVREQLVRSLVLAVEPDALDAQSTHALQHALTHAKADHLEGVVDALIHPEAGRWPVEELARWGVKPAIALSRYTDGSLSGLFDGRSASLPPTDLPILAFDFTRLDRNSPAIPALMAAIACWAEHVWLPQSTAPHRHLVLEEAWQILLSPATAGLIQRLLKFSRRMGLSIDVVMHTLSDLGTGKARDLARLCEIAHVGRLGPEEATAVGDVLGLPPWAVDAIPALAPGQAVWKVGPDYVDIVQTVLREEETTLTDTSSRRRTAQNAAVNDQDQDQDRSDAVDGPDWEASGGELELRKEVHSCESVPESEAGSDDGDSDDWDWDMPPNVVDRHRAALQAAEQGRCSEAADLAALGEREDITAHGINSREALSWLETRARVADLCGSPELAQYLRATVTHMANDAWFDQTGDDTTQWHRTGPETGVPEPAADATEPEKGARHRWRYVAVVAALVLASVLVWQHGVDDRNAKVQQEKISAYKGISVTKVDIDGVATQAWAKWSEDGKSAVLAVLADWEDQPRFARIDSGDHTAQQVVELEEMPAPIRLEVKVPVSDWLQPIRLTVAVAGPEWKEGSRAPRRTIEFHPDRTAVDVETGKQLKQHYSL
ncbi:hypothetical protein [Streptomyces sp. WMMC905]|uniref:hypothetical protein n=1 Tax=Streptomyces sp. WMMC905 TaxID=3404123 RepID=UPI003B962524